MVLVAVFEAPDELFPCQFGVAIATASASTTLALTVPRERSAIYLAARRMLVQPRVERFTIRNALFAAVVLLAGLRRLLLPY